MSTLDNLETEQPNPASRGIDARPTEEILRLMNAEDQKVALAVEAEIPRIARAVDLIVDRLSHGGRLFYLGAGTSGRLGAIDAAECPPTFRVPADLVQAVIAGGDKALRKSMEASEDDPKAGVSDLSARGFSSSDVLVGIAASGRTPYVIGAVEWARRLGAATIGITCNPGSPLVGLVDVAIIPLTGPEIIAGSTRLKAGTAAKLVLNMLSTATMIRLGHVYGNLMVNVQPTNVKLKARALRILRQAAGVSEEEANRLLEASGGNVKVAIVMAHTGLSRDKAEQRLVEAKGRVSAALEEPRHG